MGRSVCGPVRRGEAAGLPPAGTATARGEPLRGSTTPVSGGDRLGGIMALLHEAMLDDSRWPAATALIDEEIGARGSLLVCADDTANGDIRIFIAKTFFGGESRSAWQREYFRNYYADDEHLPRLRALPDGSIVPVADLFSEEELKTSRMYNECLARFGGQKGLNVRLDGPQGSRITWGISDPAEGDAWSFSQVDTIRRVLPHLRQYVRVRTALIDARVLGASVADLLDRTRLGVLHLDREGRIAEANDRAADLLRRHDGLLDQRGVLEAVVREDNTRLQNLLARALPDLLQPGASGSMMVRRPSLLPRLVVHVKPVTNRELDYQSRQVAVLVLVVDPASHVRAEPGLVRSMLGLTPTESEIVSRLAEGQTLRQIAATTGREYNTVRTHLKHVFVKLGVSRQLEVVQLLRALSDVPVSED